MLGGFKEVKTIDNHIISLVNQVKGDIEKKVGKSLLMCEPITVEQQIVSGINYRIKIHVGDNQHFMIKIHEKLPCHGSGLELLEVEEIK